MTFTKWITVAWVGITALVLWPDSPQSHAKLFCAYGRVFVEFNEGPHQWGVLMLDNEGRPIPCDDEVRDLPVNTKEII